MHWSVERKGGILMAQCKRFIGLTMATRLAFTIAIAVSRAFSLFATDYVWTNAAGDGDWANVQNYAVGGAIPSTLPSASDTVTIPDNATVRLEYDAADESKKGSCEVFGGVGRIIPEGVNAVIDVTVPVNSRLELSCAIIGSFSEPQGLLIKRGEGELDLAAVGKARQASSNYDYYTNVEVVDGILKFPQAVSTDDAFYGTVTVRNPGILFTGKVCKNLESNRIVHLYGDGTITNDHTALCEMRVNGGAFSGIISGMNYLSCQGALNLLGVNGTSHADSVAIRRNYGYGADGVHGCLGILKFGLKGSVIDGALSNTPSSIGYADAICTRDYGGAILYLGNGEMTDKDFRIWNPMADYPCTIDAGANGGLVWNGVWGLRDSNYSTANHSLARLLITGSNRTECVMNGVVETRSLSGTNYNMCITKRGTGKWRINNNTNGNMTGVWQIKDGTLAFDSIAETNINSALGKSTLLYRDFAGKPSDDMKVDYAIVLGGNETRGDLEYVGSTNCISTTRKFVVDGTGAILNNGTGLIRLSDFSVLPTRNGDSTLVLGGGNTMENAVNDVCDGEGGRLSLRKEDRGTWRVSGESTFSGNVTVDSGRLVLSRPHFTWFRWEIVSRHDNGESGSNAKTVSLNELALYDKDGKRLNVDMTDRCTKVQDGNQFWCVPTVETLGFFGGETVRNLEPNEASILEAEGYRSYWGGNYYYPLSNLFDEADSRINGWFIGKSIIMRLSEGSPEAKYWDWCHYAQNGRSVKEMRLYGSVDGRDWTLIGSRVSDWSEVDGNDGKAYPTRQNMWECKRVALGAELSDAQPGLEISIVPEGAATAFCGISSVAVAKGAELYAEGDAITVPKISIDSNGMGTLTGFALADGGTIDIVDDTGRGDFSVDADFTGVAFPEDYSFTLNGKRTRMAIRLSDDRKTISVHSRGLVIQLK